MAKLQFIDLAKVQKTVAALCNDKCNLIIDRIMEQRELGIEFLTIAEISDLTELSTSLTQHHVANMTALGLLEGRTSGNKTLVKIADFDTWADIKIAFQNLSLIIERRAIRMSEAKPLVNEK